MKSSAIIGQFNQDRHIQGHSFDGCIAADYPPNYKPPVWIDLSKSEIAAAPVLPGRPGAN